MFRHRIVPSIQVDNQTIQVVSQTEWLANRQELLQKEKELTRAHDGLRSLFRDLGMVKVTSSYLFTGGPDSKQLQLGDLFDGRQQLIVYYFMFAPEWNEGCVGCSFLADHVPHLSHLNFRDTTFVAVSRAPIEKIEAFKQRMGWTFPWYSCIGTDFNLDFHALQDESVRPINYNYEDKESLAKKGKTDHLKGDLSALSVFYRRGDEIYHSYSTYARGLEIFLTTNALLDITPLGRQEEDPATEPELCYHDRYDFGGK